MERRRQIRLRSLIDLIEGYRQRREFAIKERNVKLINLIDNALDEVYRDLIIEVRGGLQ